MLKRFVWIAAVAALPLAAACNGQSRSQEPSQAPGQAAAPSGADARPDQQAAPPAADPSARQPDETRNPASRPSDPGAPSAAPASGATAGQTALAPVTARAPEAQPAPEFKDVTIPAGTLLPVTLETGVASASSNLEDPVQATLRTPVTIEGVEALPAGSTLSGVVTAAERSGRVKGRAHVAIRFSSLKARDERLDISTNSIGRTAPATKKADATKIGIGAGAGAVVGGIIGGGSGAAKGAAIGGAGGTGVVLATRGKEVSFPAGTRLRVRLLEPITVRVPLGH